MEAKVCIRCRRCKPLSEFYHHPQMADGHLNVCKKCFLKYSHKYREENLDRLQEYDRQRGQDPKRKAANRERYKAVVATETGRKRLRAHSKRWLERNRQKRNVHIVIGNAIKRGLIIPEQCYICGEEKTQAHHEDYSKPFEITWLCTKCHGIRHREINKRKRHH